jgi:hypothetical protein
MKGVACYEFDLCFSNAKTKERSKRVHLHICRDVARTDAVNLHIVLTPFVAQCLGKLAQGTFGSGVGRNCEAALEG